MRATVVLALLAISALGVCQEQGPIQLAPPAAGADQAEGQVVLLSATWPGADLTNTSFRVFRDPEMRDPVDVFAAPGGSALAVLPPGEYYLMAVVDANGNNQVDAGDGFGFHGVSDLSGASQPAPLVVAVNQFNAASVAILMTRGDDGRLVPLASAMQRTTGTLQGSFEKGGQGSDGRPILLAVLPVEMQTRPVVSFIGPYEFELEVPAGAHRVAVIVDADDSGTLSVGDLLALRGFGEDAPVPVDADGMTVIGPLSLAPCTQIPDGIPPLVAGWITGAEIPEGGRASVAFCTDQALRSEAFTVVADGSGAFAAALPAVQSAPPAQVSEADIAEQCPAGGTHERGERDARGRLHCAKCGRFIKDSTPETPAAGPQTYYLRATIDQTGDGQLGAGDMLGFFGVSSLLTGEPPQPLEVGAGALRTDLEIPITARIDDDGRLSAWPSTGGASITAPENAGE